MLKLNIYSCDNKSYQALYIASIKAGALITATYANEFGRDVYALPGRLDDYPSQGCLKLLSQGASFILKELDELLTMLGAIPQIDAIEASPTPEQLSLPTLSPELQTVMDAFTAGVPEALASDALPFDFIVQQTGMAAGSVSSALLQLELMGFISQLPGMRYQKS
jgi:DNA processing protein